MQTEFVKSLEVVRTALFDAGCTSVMVHFDGREVIIEGSARSLQCKLEAEARIRLFTDAPIRNCLRIIPGDTDQF